MDFVYYNGNGKEYSRKRGTTKYKCYGSEGPTWYGTARTLPVYGRACAKLYLNGSLKATQCHNIQP